MGSCVMSSSDTLTVRWPDWIFLGRRPFPVFDPTEDYFCQKRQKKKKKKRVSKIKLDGKISSQL